MAIEFSNLDVNDYAVQYTETYTIDYTEPYATHYT